MLLRWAFLKNIFTTMIDDSIRYNKNTLKVEFKKNPPVLQPKIWLYYWESITFCHFPCSLQCSWLHLLWLSFFGVSCEFNLFLCLCSPSSCFVSYVCSVYLDCGGLLLPTVGLIARGTPLWPLCVSADQGGEGGGGVGGLGLEGLDCSDDDNECYGFLSFLQA